MGFKLGKGTRGIAVNGRITKKLRFGQEGGDSDISVPGTPVIRKDLEPGVMGEANMDGSIYISNEIEPGSPVERQVINHEMRHATDMKIGKLAYGDNFVQWNGKDMIIVDGVAKEAGDGNFPWEKEANNGNAYG
jgi:hypothetical protein